jgi:radical SAM superfamily enzyme YgiQ (UPF0313 family)
MKITFIQPYYENVWEALGIGYIISYCKEHAGGQYEYNFFQGKFDSDEDIINGAIGSDIVAFSCTSPAYKHGLYLAKYIKINSPFTHIVFGGWHPTALPKDVIEEDCVDQVITGEGELAMVKVILGKRKPIVKGTKLEHDELDWPDRLGIKNHRTIDLCEKMNGKRTASFQLSRGCKVHCKFCGEIGMTGKYNKKTNPIRTRDSFDLIDEIEWITKHERLDYFKLVDATFDKDVTTVLSFCDAKIKRLNTTPWEANIHPGFVQKKEVFKALAEANCEQINVGVESGSPYVLSDIGKGASLQSIKNVFKWAEEYGIKRRAFFLIGMPDETDEDIDYTIELIDEIGPDVVGFTILAPYPGSDYYNPGLHKDVDWSKVDEYSNDIWSTAHFTNSDLKDTQAYLKDRYKHLLCERQGEVVQSKDVRF